MLAHVSGLQREPPGEIWETLEAPSREELVARTADAEQLLAPGSWWHYSNLAFALLGEVVARATGGTWEEALRERVLGPLGLGRTTPEAEEPAARGYFVEPYSDAVRVERDPDMGGSGALGKLWSTVVDLARWGAFLAGGDDEVLAAATLEEMSHVRTMVDQAGWTLGWGLGLELYRSGDHLFVGHGGAMPGHLAGLVVNRSTGIGSAVLTNTSAGGRPEALALELAKAAIAALPAEAEPGSRTPARRTTSPSSSAAGGRRATSSCSRGVEGGCRRGSSTASRDGTRRSSSASTTTAGASPRVASAVSSCASSAAKAARSRSSISRPTR